MRYRESALQRSFFQWVRLQYPNLVVFAIPNGGFRNIREAVRLKAEGVLAGVPDVFLAEAKGGFSGLFIEFKAGKGRLTVKQKELIEKLRNNGFRVEVCSSLMDTMTIVKEYLAKS